MGRFAPKLTKHCQGSHISYNPLFSYNWAQFLDFPDYPNNFQKILYLSYISTCINQQLESSSYAWIKFPIFSLF